MGYKYIYSIIQADSEIDFGKIGHDGCAVCTLAHHGFACVVSDYSGEEFENMPKEKLIRHLLVHQSVIEKVMAGHTVIPIKFGTLLTNEEEVRNLLLQGQSRFADALAQNDGKIQIEVIATWDTKQVLGEIANDPQIAGAKQGISMLPAGKALDEWIRLGRMVKEELDRRRDGFSQRMFEVLRPLVVDAQPNVLMSDQMVMNVAFLVDKGLEEEFDRQVNLLNGTFNDQIDFRIIGPLPPYSFSTLEVSRPTWSEIEEAKRVLLLGDVISESAVRSAYRNMAAKFHPDSNPNDEAARASFAILRHAESTLLAYCRGLGSSEDSGKTVPITKDAVEDTFLISLKRSTTDEVESSRFGGLGGGE